MRRMPSTLPGSGPAMFKGPAPGTSMAWVGSEKQAFSASADVVKPLARRGLKAEVDSAGS